MRKLIGGKYVAVEKAAVKKKSGGKADGAAAVDIFAKATVNAQGVMRQQALGYDWTGLRGTGADGTITVADVRKFVAAQAKKAAAAR